MLAACATMKPAAGTDVTRAPDPFEHFNRVMLGVNTGLEKVIFRPVDSVYRTVTPWPVRQGLSNAALNLTSPVTFVNDLLQGKPRRAGQTLFRFVLNSTMGFAGLFDVASVWGIPGHSEDFGQTLGVWGARNGPYLVLPLIGPTTFRDGIGTGIDTITDPLFWLISDSTTSYALYGGEQFVEYDDNRDDLEALRASSLDFYSALRSSYLQDRRSEVYDGHAPPVETLPEDILDLAPDKQGTGKSD